MKGGDVSFSNTSFWSTSHIPDPASSFSISTFEVSETGDGTDNGSDDRKLTGFVLASEENTTDYQMIFVITCENLF